MYVRSRDVRDYVLARAGGVCEGCAGPAPFATASGRPYLEAHHIRRLSDGGPDDPRHVAGICPNCHRRAHYASDRSAFNAVLQRKVNEREANLEN
ncbi:HNH endonuclease [Sphingomonas sp.]|uniref:HNH endonuclease n=1 Tax=Sphingomonas sp. TaxID=28214 RepID=UPI003B000212